MPVLPGDPLGRIVNELCEGLGFGLSLLLKLANPIGDCVHHIARRLLRALARRLNFAGRSVLLTGALFALYNLNDFLIRHDDLLVP